MKKHLNLWAIGLVLSIAGATLAQVEIDYGIANHQRITSDAGSLDDNIIQAWDHLDHIVTQECQRATNFQLNSPEEQQANSIVCAEVGRFFQNARDRARSTMTHEQFKAKPIGTLEEFATEERWSEPRPRQYNPSAYEEFEMDWTGDMPK